MVFAQSFGFSFCLTPSLSTDIEKAMLSTMVPRCVEREKRAEEELFQFMTSVLDLIVKPVTLSN